MFIFLIYKPLLNKIVILFISVSCEYMIYIYKENSQFYFFFFQI